MGGDTSNPNQMIQHPHMGGDTLNPNQIIQHPHMGRDTSNPNQMIQHPYIGIDTSNLKTPNQMTHQKLPTSQGGRHFKPPTFGGRQPNRGLEQVNPTNTQRRG